MIEVRPAVESDVPLILSLIRALAEYEKLAHLAVATEAQLQRHLFGPRPAAEVLIALADGEAAAFALFFQTFSTFLGGPGIWLEDLFVLPEFRRRGIGGRLLEAVGQTAVQRRCLRVDWAVLDWNEPALALYRKRRAKVLEDWRICRVEGEALGRLAEVRGS